MTSNVRTSDFRPTELQDISARTPLEEKIERLESKYAKAETDLKVFEGKMENQPSDPSSSIAFGSAITAIGTFLGAIGVLTGPAMPIVSGIGAGLALIGAAVMVYAKWEAKKEDAEYDKEFNVSANRAELKKELSEAKRELNEAKAERRNAKFIDFIVGVGDALFA